MASGGTQEAIIFFPEYELLKKETARLRMELSMLVLERDQLRLVECRNIEMSYMLALGGLEYQIYRAQCTVLRLKRKTELIQARRNRMERINFSQIEACLDAEFAEYQRRLDEQLDKMNEAIEWSQAEVLSEPETQELKRLYRKIIKALHPDLHPELTDAQLRLFEKAVLAYRNADLNTIRLIYEMADTLPDTEQSSVEQLRQERERLLELLHMVRDSIEKIKSEFPYTVKELVNDPEQLAERKRQLQSILQEYKKAIDIYEARIKELLR